MDFADRTNVMLDLINDSVRPGRALEVVGLQDAHVETDPGYGVDDPINKTLYITYQGETITLRAERRREWAFPHWSKAPPGWSRPDGYDPSKDLGF